MHRLGKVAGSAIVAVALAALVAPPAGAQQGGADTTGAEQEFVVLFAEGASAKDARAAVAAAGGTIVSENTDVGVATVVTTASDFAEEAAAQSAIEGTALNRVVAEVPDAGRATHDRRKVDAVEDEANAAFRGHGHGHGVKPKPKPFKPGKPSKPAAEPLASLQWDMQAIGATTDGSYRYEKGKGVLVGIIDTGVDGSHPDIAPNFNKKLSRNFTVDIPFDANGTEIDGPCEDEPDQSCSDPVDVDEDGHGTHVASTIASPINGLGIAGVAPEATIVNLRAGQDSGYFFLEPAVDALTYAGRIGVDVVNMSFYVDPWLFNCTNHPTDSPADQQEQRTIITAMQRALDFARLRGVTLVSAAGNGATDYTKVISDSSSPDFADVPGEVSYTRDLLDPKSCVSMPSEGRGVISVSSTGPTGRKAYYSDYGNGYIDVAAPGGDAYDTPDGTLDYGKLILAAYPKSLAEYYGEIDENGDPVVDYVVKSCTANGRTCAYYQDLQGTSMASPHAAGVAALIVGRYGIPDFLRGGTYLPPSLVEDRLEQTAVEKACPSPAAFTYVRHLSNGSTATATHTCEGTRSHNGFYGSGIISALKAIGR